MRERKEHLLSVPYGKAYNVARREGIDLKLDPNTGDLRLVTLRGRTSKALDQIASELSPEEAASMLAEDGCAIAGAASKIAMGITKILWG